MKIKEVARVIGGATPSTKHPEYYDGGIVWATPKDLSDQGSKYFFSGERTISDLGLKSCAAEIIPAYNILMSSRAPIGLIAINKVDCCTNQGFKSLVLNRNLCDVNYMYYYMKHHLKEIEALGSGTTFKEISKSVFEQWEIILPTLEKQKEVSNVLAAIDEKIETNRAISAKLEKLAATIYNFWFLQFDFPNENGRPYKSSGGKMIWNSDLKREVPEGFRVVDIKNTCQIIDCLHSKKPDYSFERDSCYLLGLENITKEGYIDLSKKYYISRSDYEKWASKIEVRENDFVVTNAGRAGDIGKLPHGVVCAIGRNITAIRPISINAYYLRQFFKSVYTQEQIASNLDNGSFFNSFNVKSIKKLKLLMPSNIIYEKACEKFSSIVQQIETVQEENSQLASLRDFLLPLLMNGQVTFK